MFMSDMRWKKIPAIIAMSPERGQTQTNDHDRLKGPSGPDISIFRAILAGGENHIFFYSICIVAKRDARFFRDSLKNIGIEKSIKLIAPSGCYPGYWGDFRVVFFLSALDDARKLCLFLCADLQFEWGAFVDDETSSFCKFLRFLNKKYWLLCAILHAIWLEYPLLVKLNNIVTYFTDRSFVTKFDDD